MATRDTSLDIPSIAFGFTLAFFVLTGTKIARQASSMYKRTGRFWNPYPWMCSIELFVNLIIGVTTWLYLRGDIQRSFVYLFCTIVLWTLQTQLIIQIIANRVALVLHDQRKGVKLKWALFIAVGLINISVFCIWIPARLEISETFIRINDIWDRIEKVIYLVIDLLLNGYFLYLVRSRLITKGLDKYKRLFNFNAIIVFVSLSMDVLIIAMMSLENTFIYVQFHPVAYIVKLNIECSMADLISKVVRGKERTDGFHPDSNSNPTELTSHTRTGKGSKHTTFSGHLNSQHRAGVRKADPDEISLEKDEECGHSGIMKTVATTVTTAESSGKEGRNSVSSSTVNLSDEYRVGAKPGF